MKHGILGLGKTLKDIQEEDDLRVARAVEEANRESPAVTRSKSRRGGRGGRGRGV
jgi:hypothetical protein